MCTDINTAKLFTIFDCFSPMGELGSWSWLSSRFQVSLSSRMFSSLSTIFDRVDISTDGLRIFLMSYELKV